MKRSIGVALVSLVASTGGVLFLPAVGGAAEAQELCYLVADSNADAVDGDAEDLLTQVDRSDVDPATNETDIGTGTGTFNIEAIAAQPGTGVLFAADGATLGTLDTTTGRFTEIGPVGTGTGTDGTVKLNDIDGLSFDATTGFLYGTHRRPKGNDLLLRIDPSTGAVVSEGIAGADYVVIPGLSRLPDIDDLAVDPEDGQMYAIANRNGNDDHLVRIDKLTGLTTDVGVLGAADMEGLSFAGGQLMGTTGKNKKEEGLWDIDKATGAADSRRPLDNGRDYEAFDCLNAPNPLVTVPSPPPVPVAAPEPAPEPEPAPVVEPETAVRQPAAVGSAAAPSLAAEPVPAAELPRTGAGASSGLVPMGGLSLALGGLAVIGGTRRRRIPGGAESFHDCYPGGLFAPLAQSAEHFHGKDHERSAVLTG